jgi:hypothetical protein
MTLSWSRSYHKLHHHYHRHRITATICTWRFTAKIHRRILSSTFFYFLPSNHWKNSRKRKRCFRELFWRDIQVWDLHILCQDSSHSYPAVSTGCMSACVKMCMAKFQHSRSVREASKTTNIKCHIFTQILFSSLHRSMRCVCLTVQVV